MIYKRKLVLQLLVLLVPLSLSSPCPSSCTCTHRTVRCTRAEPSLLARLPRDTLHLYLSQSSLPSLGPGDLPDLPLLSSLSLANSQLTSLLPGAFSSTPQLQRLDLSYNLLSQLSLSSLSSLPRLLVLKANNNLLTCLSTEGLAQITQLEVLSLQGNQLSSLPPSLASLSRLRQLRVDRNPLDCGGCSTMSWLPGFLRDHPDLGLGATCRTPRGLAGRAVAAVLSHQLQDCSGAKAEEECGGEHGCPEGCKCSGGTVDCRNLGLTRVPGELPADTKELRLERNNIEEIPDLAFKTAPGLRRIDLSRNKLRKISAKAFTYNRKLTTLIMYDNQLSSLPPSSLAGLYNLQMILLNKNALSCLPRDLFRDQSSLVLLSLYDNMLTSLPEGIFSPLKLVSTLHLGRNPWSCTCPLLPLSRFLHRRGVEATGAACKNPIRLEGRTLELVKPSEFECAGTGPVKQGPETCSTDIKCPPRCVCSSGTVDCQGAGLSSLPANIPASTHTLLLDRNSLSSSSFLSLACSSLPSLRHLSARHNQLSVLEPAHLYNCGHLHQLELGHNRLALLSGRLRGLRGLRRLGLLGNHISCVQRKALEELEGLEELELDLRYFSCSCESDLLKDWMVQRRFKVVNYNCPASSIDCGLSSQQSSCSLDTACPQHCVCQASHVTCRRRGLTWPPSPLPLLTTELLLSHNSLTLSHNSSLTQSLVRLTSMDLSHNSIQHLDSSSLPHLPRLTTLNLSNNRIQCISVGAFRRLPLLSSLSLQQNDLAGLQHTAFSSLAPLKLLELGRNPLHCDCRLSWFSTWLSDHSPSLTSSPTCSSPASLEGRSLAALPSRALLCTGDPRDPVQARCDPCFSQPCQHGGLCIRETEAARLGQRFTCQCPSFYTGALCGERRDPCTTRPCRNGGTCQSRRGEVSCSCPPGWQGRLCETNTDDCSSHSCQHGGVCRDGMNSYTCQCVAGWQGDFCQVAGSQSTSSAVALYPGPAQALGGACQLCQHGATCRYSQGSTAPTCSCSPGYSGTFCEVSPTVQVLAYQQASPCQASPCKHGSCLAAGGHSGYTCRCHPGYSGKHCEYLTTVQLAGERPYLQLDPLYTSRPLNLTLVVKTTEAAGMLLYHGDTDHLAVELFHGRVRVSLDVGNPPASTMFSYAVLNDDKPHAVELLLSGKNLTMRVDGGLARSLINKGPQELLSITSPTFLGGLPEQVGEAALARWHLRNSTSLRGCITNFYIDDKTIDFLQAAHRRPGVLAGCHQRYLSSGVVLQEQGGRSRSRDRGRKEGCEGNRCREPGTRGCSPKEGGNYRCRCKRGFAGRYCERAPTCRKKKVRAHTEEHGCRSRKLVTQRRCQGECHGEACCTPTKVKKKKIRMICQDGTRYVKTVEIVRKCSCSRKKSSSCPATNYKNLLRD